MTSIETLLGAAKRIDLLTPEREQELAEQLHAEDPITRIEARNTLIAANIRFAATLAYGYAKTSGISVDDYMSAALEAMVKNSEKFDPSKANYCTFIKPWIRKALHEVHYGETNLAIPRHKHIAIHKIKTATERLVAKSGPFVDITDDMISAETGMKVSEIQECRYISQKLASGTVSLQQPMWSGDDGGGVLEDVVSENLHSDGASGYSPEVATALMSLSATHRAVLELSTSVYGDQEMTPARISKMLEKTRHKAAVQLAARLGMDSPEEVTDSFIDLVTARAQLAGVAVEIPARLSPRRVSTILEEAKAAMRSLL
jgi:DNA-directed RNA polymerase sigma subunit (sigma70/sigma32)